MTPEEVQMLVMKHKDNSTVVFTDGSAHGNPGPAGAGMVMFLPTKGEQSEDTGYVRKRIKALGVQTNNMAELAAVAMTLQELEEVERNQRIYQDVETTQMDVILFTDSTYVIGSLTDDWYSMENADQIERIQHKIEKMEGRGHTI